MNQAPGNTPSPLRHWGGFIAAGLTALAIDAAILTLLSDGLGVSPYVARLFSISVAMLASWQINRRITFAVQAPSSLAEFGRFAAVSWIAQAINYTVFAAILLLRPDTSSLLALVIASMVAMLASYAGFRFGVFSKT